MLSNQPTTFRRRKKVHIDSTVANASQLLAAVLKGLWRQEGIPSQFVCIGTDRSTGDALGPLVGSAITGKVPSSIRVYGTLESPVHGANLQGYLSQSGSPRERTMAIDASLGKVDDIGMVWVGIGPLQPGAGLQKQLPSVGHYHLVGTVNAGGFMDYFVLQNTRLSVVMTMASVIAEAIVLSLKNDS